MDGPSWTSAHVDSATPNPARVYDYLLGGTHSFEADRETAERIQIAWPDVRRAVWVYLRFLRRVVRHRVDMDVTQFLDLGSGLPTIANIHETAQQLTPDTRVVYVDVDPVAHEHCRVMLSSNSNASAVHADLRDADRVLNDPKIIRLLDFTRPIALITAAVLHFIPDRDDPAGIVRQYTDRLTPGSYFAITHASNDSAQWDKRGGELSAKRGELDLAIKVRNPSFLSRVHPSHTGSRLVRGLAA